MKKRFILANISREPQERFTLANISREPRKRFTLANISSRLADRKPRNSSNLSKVSNISSGPQGKEGFLPWLKDGTELVIPMDSPDKYRWWAGGQSVLDTLLELDATEEVIEKYISEIGSGNLWKRWLKIRAGNSRKKKLMAVKRTSQKCKRFKG